ncbi:MAG: c-type cytochrome [Polyangiaceae bacterium]
MWLAIGGLFAVSSVWAVYAELFTRVPWQKYQSAFFDMELEQARQARDRAQQQWDGEIAPGLEKQLARQKELDESKTSGEYKTALDRLHQLDKDFSAAETGKTFGGSDLDEAYYYRNLGEYDRDAASVEVRNAYREMHAEDAKKGEELGAAVYADPAAGLEGEGSLKMHHLHTEIARMEAHIAQIDRALAENTTGRLRKALEHSRETEATVAERIKVELKHQQRVDDAVAAMARIDGPPEPSLTERDEEKRAAERTAERARVCQGHEDTRNCLKWMKIEPVDLELKALDVEVKKRQRILEDARQRFTKAEDRADPKFNAENLIATMVGPFQIQQVVLNWIDYDRDVDKEQVDRCHTCHMGVDNGNYNAASIPRQFRTHPNRSWLLAAHPVEKFGCTACHQGQGRATDMLSHSSWQMETHHEEERWHYVGDHYWEDPLLPVGKLTKVIVDDGNDELQVKIQKGKFETVKIAPRNAAAHLADETVPEHYATEVELFAELQEKVAAIVDVDADVKAKWHAVVGKVDNRVQIGLEPNDPAEHINAKDFPVFAVKFTKPGTASLLGFDGLAELTARAPLHTAPEPPVVPIRSEGMPSLDKTGRYAPPRGDQGLQVPDEMRNRFIQALPEVESGCLRCHQTDVDLKPRRSKAKYVAQKLEYEKAEAHRKADPVTYARATGTSDLPPVPDDPAAAIDPVPTFDEGRAVFRSLNCTGCHILDNYPWDKNAGPNLDNLTAKVTPEWILTWIRDPRGWRAKTSMPNLWPKPLDPASKRPYAAGSPEFEKWQKQMRDETVAIASFLVERSENPATRPGATKDAQPLRGKVQGYANVAGASAEKGKAAFEAYGCQGCHARGEGDTETEKLPEAWRARERDIAPTLANMGSKTSADWIAYWVEDPSRYWHGTKMPNVRLTREEAASVGQYIASLKTPPLHPATVDAGDVATVADAAKRTEKVACATAGGTMMSRAECGERLIGYYGCFGCHGISGFEKSAPVAPELGGFAKKDISTLDFGYAIADHHLQTTETFATMKLDSPRIYKRDRIELKMGDFDLSSREIRALVTFLKGLSQVKPRAAYNPLAAPNYNAALEGRQLVDDLNCRGCHVIEDRGGDIDGFRQSLLAADSQQRAPFLGGEGARVQPEWLFSFLRDPQTHGIRPWLHPEWAWGNAVPADKRALRMPTFTLANEQWTAIVRYFAAWDGQEYPYQVPRANEQTEEQKLYALTHMVATDKANCLSCHYQGEFPVQRGQTELAKMAPNLNMVRSRLRPEWVRQWLLRPQNYLPYTKMTAFWATVDREKDNPAWPAESDPFRSPAQAWDKAPFPAGPWGDQATVELQVEAVRDFLFGLPSNAVFPPPGQEAASPLVRSAPAEAPAAEAAPAEGGKPGPGDKPAPKPGAVPKKTGMLPGGPVHLNP